MGIISDFFRRKRSTQSGTDKLEKPMRPGVVPPAPQDATLSDQKDAVRPAQMDASPPPTEGLSTSPKATISEITKHGASQSPLGIRAMRDKDITDSNIEYLVRRNALAYDQVIRLKKDPWRGGYNLSSLAEELADTSRQLLDWMDFDEQISRALVYSYVFGVAGLYIDVPVNGKDGSKKDPVAKLQKPSSKKISDEKIYNFDNICKKLVPITKKQIKQFWYKDGEIEFWEIYKSGSNIETELIHESRMIHMPFWLLSNDPKGTSALLPQWDPLTDLENANMALIESLIKSSTGIVDLELPTDHSPDADQIGTDVTQEDWDYAEEKFKDIDLMKHFIHPRDWKIDVKSMQKGANPGPYMDNIYKLISSGSRIAKVVLTGAEQGQLTGSEYIIKQYHELIGEWRIEITKHGIAILKRFQEWGVLPEGRIEWTWNPVDTPTQAETALLNRDKATTFFVVSNAIEKWEKMGWKLEVWNGKAIFAKVRRSGEVIGIDAPDIFNVNILEDYKPEQEMLERLEDVHPSEYKQIPVTIPEEGEEEPEEEEPEEEKPKAKPEEEEEDAHHSDKVKITKEIRDKILKDWSITALMEENVGEHVPKFLIALQEMIDDYMKRWTKAMETIGFKDERPPTQEIIRISLKLQMKEKKLTLEIEGGIEDGWGDGWNQTRANLGFPEDWVPGNPASAEYLMANVDTLTAQIKQDVSGEVINAMREGLLKGQRYDEVYRGMRTAGLAWTAKHGPNIVQKMMHEAIVQSGFDAMIESGAMTKEQPFTYVTMGDKRVRPEHAEREGNIYKADMRWELFSEWGCRCRGVPTLAVERAMGRPLTRAEYGAPDAEEI